MKKTIVLMTGIAILLLAGCQNNEAEIFLIPPVTDTNEPIVSNNQSEDFSMFFKKAWENKLEGSDITDDVFTTSDGTEVPVRMIIKKMEILNTSGNEYFDIIEAPYEDGTFSMTILIPKDGISLDKAESMITSRNIAKWDAILTNNLQEVALPEFVLDQGKELVFPESNEIKKITPSVNLKSFNMNRPFFFVIRPIIDASATNNSRSVVFTGKVGITIK